MGRHSEGLPIANPNPNLSLAYTIVAPRYGGPTPHHQRDIHKLTKYCVPRVCTKLGERAFPMQDQSFGTIYPWTSVLNQTSRISRTFLRHTFKTRI